MLLNLVPDSHCCLLFANSHSVLRLYLDTHSSISIAIQYALSKLSSMSHCSRSTLHTLLPTLTASGSYVPLLVNALPTYCIIHGRVPILLATFWHYNLHRLSYLHLLQHSDSLRCTLSMLIPVYSVVLCSLHLLHLSWFYPQSLPSISP